MATILKHLGQGSGTNGSVEIVENPTPGSAIYQVAVISLVAQVAGNPSPRPVVSVHLVRSGGSVQNSNKIYEIELSDDNPVSADFGQGHVLEAGDKIYLNCGTNVTYMSCTVSGVEIS
jgi:hypothetical protein